jgi:hypothetical protein
VNLARVFTRLFEHGVSQGLGHNLFHFRTGQIGRFLVLEANSKASNTTLVSSPRYQSKVENAVRNWRTFG